MNNNRNLLLQNALYRVAYQNDVRLHNVEKCDENRRIGELAARVWGQLIADAVDSDALVLEMWSDKLRQIGLIGTIALCEAVANDFVELLDAQGTSIAFEPKLNASKSEVLNESSWQDAFLWAVWQGVSRYGDLGVRTREILEVLRFLKRFTYYKHNALERGAIAKLISLNKSHFDREASLKFNRSFARSYLKRIRAHLTKQLHGWSDWLDPANRICSGGACHDAKTITEKAFCLHRYDAVELQFRNAYVRYARKVPDWCEILSVPKSYKTARVIAEECTVKNFHAQEVRAALITCDYLNGNDILTHDQASQILRARDGALKGVLATVDISGASDSINRYIAYQAFPLEIWDRCFRPIMSEYLYDPKSRKMYWNNIFLTSGNAATWNAESEFYLAATEATRDIYIELTHDDDVEHASVYGDDIVCDVKLVELLAQHLDALGIKVNADKTFSGAYRECCGAEFLLHSRVDTVYWPRKHMLLPSGRPDNEQEITTIASLISLQHRIYDRYPSAAAEVERAVLSCMPDMTYSAPGSECDDLWGTHYPTRKPNFRLYAGDQSKCPDNVRDWLMRDQHYHLTVVPCPPWQEFSLVAEGYLYRQWLAQQGRYCAMKEHSYSYYHGLSYTVLHTKSGAFVPIGGVLYDLDTGRLVTERKYVVGDTSVAWKKVWS